MKIRLDDFPSGVRVINTIHFDIYVKILDAFQEKNIDVYLGVVPVLLRDYWRDYKDLNEYTNIIPCQHGFNHRYDEFSKRLIKANDPLNHNSTVGIFDENENKDGIEISLELIEGRNLLKRYFKRVINTFIPVCNVLNKNTLLNLEMLNFHTLLTDGNIPRPTNLDVVKSDYCGILGNMNFTKKYNLVCLHITWECEWIKNNSFDEWKILLNKFVS